MQRAHDKPVMDLNSDLGEGFGIWKLGDDDALLEVVTSANVACGFHGGDPSIMRHVCEQAAGNGVAIGAQVGYRDLPGFGRRHIDVDPRELVNDVIYQIAALDGFARVAGSRVSYVKPHGALYNTIVSDASQAAAVAEAVYRYDSTLPVLGLPGSQWLRLASQSGLQTVPEAFADRAYTAQGHLVSRRLEGSVLHDPDVIVRRCLQMAQAGTVTAVDGTVVENEPRSICVHGDTPGAVEIARAVRAALTEAGVELRSFSPGPVPAP